MNLALRFDATATRTLVSLLAALAFSYVLTVTIVGILLGGAPAWVLYDPAPDSVSLLRFRGCAWGN